MRLKAILTGDIVGSREVDSVVWGKALRRVLEQYATRFDIYRGDSFQAELPVASAVECCMVLMAELLAAGNIGVRVGVGVGTVDRMEKHVQESTGEAFIRSGKAFDQLKKELFRMETPWSDVNEQVNLIFGLCVELMGRWTPNMAESFLAAWRNPSMSQKQLAELLNRKHQSQISTELSKAGYAKIIESIHYCTRQLQSKC
ncbi:hypothetical protein ACFSQ3_07890 [Sphingobacterium corticis]|uniref:SatD family (SatD) n=1 Tax=Sphingobacterium corticis TaxID=1812823 RepID=A0ABW5NIL8_9SPHI